MRALRLFAEMVAVAAVVVAVVSVVAEVAEVLQYFHYRKDEVEYRCEHLSTSLLTNQAFLLAVLFCYCMSFKDGLSNFVIIIYTFLTSSFIAYSRLLRFFLSSTFSNSSWRAKRFSSN